jgi:hypothetical protein
MPQRNAARQIAVGLVSCFALALVILIISPTTSAAEIRNINMGSVGSEVREVLEDVLQCVESVDNRVLSESGSEPSDMYYECRIELCARVPGTNQHDCGPNQSMALQLLVHDSFEKLLIASANAPSLMGLPFSYTTEMNNGYQSYISDRQYDCAMQSMVYPNQHRYFIRRCLEGRDWEQFLLYKNLTLGLERLTKDPE